HLFNFGLRATRARHKSSAIDIAALGASGVPFLHLLGERLQTSMAHTCIRNKGIPDRRRQALLERRRAAGVDVDLITLQPIAAPLSFFAPHRRSSTKLRLPIIYSRPTVPAALD